MCDVGEGGRDPQGGGAEEGKQRVSSESLSASRGGAQVGAILTKLGVEVTGEENGTSMTKLEMELGEGKPPLTNVHWGKPRMRCVNRDRRWYEGEARAWQR